MVALNGFASVENVSSHKVVFGILAGGRGTRLWPLSTTSHPKQFLRLFSGKSLLRLTVDRVTPLCSEATKLLVITSAQHTDLAVEEALGATVVAEPVGRDTAGAFLITIAYALVEEESSTAVPNDAVVVLLPTDHLFANEAEFRVSVERAVSFAASNDSIVLLGVPATSAHPGYGYVQAGAELSEGIYRVSTFCEKPSCEIATEMFCGSIGEPGLLWSTGITIARASVLKRAFDQYLPLFGAGIDRLISSLKVGGFSAEVSEVFSALPPTSFSSSVQQLADNLAILKMSNPGWLDVGSWDAWASTLEKDDKANYGSGESLLLQCERVVVQASDRPVVVIGAKDIVVVETEKAVLICAPECAQEVKTAVDLLAKRGHCDVL